MRKFFKYLILLSSLSLVMGTCMYFTYKARKTVQKEQAGRDKREFLPQLLSPADFIAMQGAPLSDKFNNVRTVKVVYDRNSQKLYFINSAKYEFHYNFCVDVLNCSQPLSIFNTINYGNSDKRDYLLANINHYEQSNTYTLEVSSEDRIKPGQLSGLYELIKKNSYLADTLKVFLGSDYITKMYNDGELKMPVITPSEIYKGQKYQLLNKGTTFGYLRAIDDLGKEYEQVHPEDIIIIKGTPVNIPICAGIIATSLQTPLSHINVLCHNRNIVSAVDISILEKPWVRELIGKPVMISVNEDSVTIIGSTKEEVAKQQTIATNKKEIKLRSDLSQVGLITAREMGESDKNTIGNKAVGVGMLYKIARKQSSAFYVPEGVFAIPFAHYNKHISNPAIKQEIEKLLNDKSNDPVFIKKQLKEIRKAIKAAPVDPQLLQDVSRQMLAAKAGKSFRFRSSSNAEDMAGFSGAGLYDSKTGILDDTAKSIEKAIKDVWASAWSEPAYTERKWFHIDQRSMMMGILVHRNFPDEVANGVAITKNLYRPDLPGFTINVQKGEVSVVSPPENVTCEQFICMRADAINVLNSDITADYITHSSITGNAPVLTMEQITLLYKQLEIIKQYFYYKQSNSTDLDYEHFALDMEFKFEKNGRLYIKQVRPYQ